MRFIRRQILSIRNSVTLALALAGNDALAQVITITEAISTPIPVWAIGLLSLMLAILGYWALRTRLPRQLNRLRGWPLLAIASAASLALVASGAWLSRADATPAGVTFFSITGNPTISSPVSIFTDIQVTNAVGTFTIGSITVSCGAVDDALPGDANAPGAPVAKGVAICNLVPPSLLSSSPQCLAGLTLNPGGVCWLRVEPVDV